METPNRKFGEWGQFDRYCKLVLYHEAIDYLREMQRRRDMEISLDELSPHSGTSSRSQTIIRVKAMSFIPTAMTCGSTTSL